MTMKVTGDDVALLANVSRSAVSRTFTPGTSVSKKTREKVIEAAKALGYRPNLMARSLMTQRTNIIALVVSQLSNPFFSNILSLFNKKLISTGYQCMVFVNEDEDSNNNNKAYDKALAYQVDGIIVFANIISPEILEEFVSANTACVVFSRLIEGLNVDQVWIDGVEAGGRVAEQFILENRKRVMLLEGESDQRLGDLAKGFVNKIRSSRSNMQISVESGYYTYEGGAKALENYYKKNLVMPDAIFSITDPMAMGAYDYLKTKSDVKVPQSASIIGTGDIPQASWMSYSMSTLKLPIEEMIDSTVDLLRNSIESEELTSAEKLTLNCNIVHRQTTLSQN